MSRERARTVGTFTVITPCFQAEAVIRRTVESILAQYALRSGRLSLQYLVCDGESRDRTVEIAREAVRHFDYPASRASVAILSEPDGGMYEALAKGLRRAEGDVVSYLNAGDLYHPAAFDVVADLFETGRVRWLTGLNLNCNHRHQVIRTMLPWGYRRAHIRRGVYGLVAPEAIQQESTFWDRSLHATIDFDTLVSLRLAGDFYLWRRFAEVADLNVVDSHLGSFTQQAGQLSSDWGRYLDEMRRVAEPLRVWDRLRARWDRLRARSATPHRKTRMNPHHLWRWHDPSGTWRTRR
jgi:glycosyltransferase involved in cell wall biosynthesis